MDAVVCPPFTTCSPFSHTRPLARDARARQSGNPLIKEIDDTLPDLLRLHITPVGHQCPGQRVHNYQLAVRARQLRPQRRLTEAPDVIEHRHMLCQRPAYHLRLGGIYADAAGVQCRYDRRQPCDLLGGTDGRGIGVTAGRAQVHTVGALRQQLAGVLQRALRVEVVPPVREGVRGQIDDADDRGHRLSMPD